MNRQVGAGMSEGGGLPAPPDGERMEIDLRTASAAAGAPAAEHSGEQMHEQPQPQQGGGPALGAIQEESEISTAVKPSMSGEKRSRGEKEQAVLDTATQRTAELALEKHDPMEQEQTAQEG